MLVCTLSILLVFFASTSCEKILEGPGTVRIPLKKDLYHSRHIRDLNFPQLKKPSHHDIVIPNWNPNARIQPWQAIGVKSRNKRTVGESLRQSISPVTDRHPRSVNPLSYDSSQQLQSKETVFRRRRNTELASQQLNSQERVLRSAKSVEQFVSQQVASQESVI